MTSNRMEAKAMAGEQGRFWGRERVPLVKTRWGEQWMWCDTAFVAFRGGRSCPCAHENERAWYFHDNEGHQGSWHDCGACRRLFGEDACRRRWKERGNAPLYERKVLKIMGRVEAKFRSKNIRLSRSVLDASRMGYRPQPKRRV